MSITDNPYPVREAGGVQFPAPGTWDIDPDHAEVAFVGRHFMVTKVRGRFTDVRGSIVIGESLDDSSVEVTIAMASVDSGSPARDEHLRSPELFDVERFPEATFTSTSASWNGTRGTLTGQLTIHGITRPVVLDVQYEGYARDPWGGDRAMFSGQAVVNREDFGITWNMALETGGVLVSKEIRVEINIETVHRPPGA